MFRSHRFRKLALCLGFLATAIMGAPIRPDEIADLLRMDQQAKIEMSVRKEGDDTSDEDTDTTLRECVYPRHVASQNEVL